jgi:hypothetical protein
MIFSACRKLRDRPPLYDKDVRKWVQYLEIEMKALDSDVGENVTSIHGFMKRESDTDIQILRRILECKHISKVAVWGSEFLTAVALLGYKAV